MDGIARILKCAYILGFGNNAVSSPPRLIRLLFISIGCASAEALTTGDTGAWFLYIFQKHEILLFYVFYFLSLSLVLVEVDDNIVVPVVGFLLALLIPP